MSTQAGKKFLLIGGTGMLGRAWQVLLSERGISFDAPTRADVDLAQLPSIEKYFQQHEGDAYSVAINCAAWTDVDGAEKSEQQALAVNGLAVGELLRCCTKRNIKLVHYGTDYVFDGEGNTPYPVDYPRRPINAYGRTKAVGEVSVQQANQQHLLIRTSWVYSPWAKNFVRAIVEAARQKPQLEVLDDQRGRPTSAEYLAKASLDLIERDARGIFHVADDGDCSRFEMARHIVEVMGAPCRVVPCKGDKFPRPAKRPAYSVLDLSATKAVLGEMPHWKTNLADAVRRIEA